MHPTRHARVRGVQVRDFNSATGYPRAAPSKSAPVSAGGGQAEAPVSVGGGQAEAPAPPPNPKKLTKEQKKAYGDNKPFFARSAKERRL